MLRVFPGLCRLCYNDNCYALEKVIDRIYSEKHLKVIEAKELYRLAENNVSQNETIHQLTKRVKSLERIIAKVQRAIKLKGE